MHLFLIRHGETEHNVAGLLAGVTDSKLTNHGVLQTQKLAKHLVQDRELRFSHLYASDLQRAYMTAEEIRKSHNNLPTTHDPIDVVRLDVLREQDFGSLELVSWSSRHAATHGYDQTLKATDPSYKPKETAEAMKKRAEMFLDDFIVPLVASEVEMQVRVAVVSHGLFLGCLWRSILGRFNGRRIVLSTEAQTVAGSRPLEHSCSWTNTGYLELSIENTSLTTNTDKVSQTTENNLTASSLPFSSSTLKIRALNSKSHLSNLKRTRGGVGSAAYDERQRSLEGFFKKQRLDG